MSDQEENILTEGGTVVIFIVGVAYAFLTILLATRLFYKIKHTTKPMRTMSIWVLLGFVIACLSRAVSLFWMGVTRKAQDNVLIFPSVVFFFLIFLLILMWNKWISERQGVSSLMRNVLLVILALLTVTLMTLVIWRIVARSTMFKFQEEIILSMDVALCFIAFISLCIVARELRKEAREHMNDNGGAAKRLFHGCIVFAAFTAFRGVWILVVNQEPKLWGNNTQSVFIPAFYSIQWFALLFSVGMLVGPQQRQSMATQVSTRAVDVAFLTSQALRSPPLSPRGTPIQINSDTFQSRV